MMSGPAHSSCNLYEFPLLRRITGDTLRPGGLELTGDALERCGLKPPAVVLDIGCGAGAVLELLTQQGYTAVGLDRSPLLAREAGRKGAALRADAGAVPLRSGSVDAVLCECVLSLLPDPARMLRECIRVLRPGGRLALSDMTRLAPACGPDAGSCLDGAKTEEDMRALLCDAGFVVDEALDYRRKLRELAAKMVWEFGSTEGFWQMWQQRDASGVRACAQPATPPCGKSFGYTLWIAHKGDCRE